MNENSKETLWHINAPRHLVYNALINPKAIAIWKAPKGMTCHVHTFEAREGGTFRISLTYDMNESGATGKGKTTPYTDTYHGRFAKLVPNKLVVEVDEFETTDPDLQGQMRISYTLSDAKDGGTEIIGLHEGLPKGVSSADDELGWKMSLTKLATLLEVAS